jgi:hypothetical protein
VLPAFPYRLDVPMLAFTEPREGVGALVWWIGGVFAL